MGGEQADADATLRALPLLRGHSPTLLPLPPWVLTYATALGAPGGW